MKTGDSDFFKEILTKLNRVVGPDKHGWYTALCPFHDDEKHPNLRVSGTGFKCMACGVKGNLKRLGEKLEVEIPGNNKAYTIEQIYDYKDENEKLLFQVVRYKPKLFKQRRPNGKSGWLWNLDKVPRTIYRLPEILTSIKKDPVFICEGEKSVDLLVKLGLTATCSPMGAGKWSDDFAHFFQNRKVVVLPDNDTPGEFHANKVAASISRTCSSIKVVHLPNLGAKQDVYDWIQQGNTIADLLALMESTSEWQSLWGSNVLNEIKSFIKRFVVLSDAQLTAIVLWIVHTYIFDAVDTTPYLNITSPEKRSGKTRLLEVLELLVSNPWYTGRVTPAVLARKIDAENPTLLLDEYDAAFKGDKEYSETLRSILNTGYRRGGKASICVGQDANIGYKDLNTFCPKTIAGIGKLPDTVEDRSIPIKLRRRSSSEPVERFKKRKVEQETTELRKKIIAFASGLSLLDAEPNIPIQLDDRAADCWEILISIANFVGDGWEEMVRSAAIELMTGERRQDESRGTKLLNDIFFIFENTDQIFSSSLASKLSDIEESPWEGLSTRKLAALLNPYGIKPATIRIGEKTMKGYRKTDFSDVFSRYLSWDGMRSVTSVTSASQHDNSETNDDPSQKAKNTLKNGNVTVVSQSQLTLSVTDVTDKTPDIDENDNSFEEYFHKIWSS